MVSADFAREILGYNSETGVFTWKTRRGARAFAGAVAGSLDRKGYQVIIINRRTYMAHRLAWLIMYGNWPLDQIDHINNVKSDNRLANLRQATGSQNLSNVPLTKRNKSGVRGVSWNPNRRKWVAEIRVNTKLKHLGYFEDIADAATAYRDASVAARGEFARAE